MELNSELREMLDAYLRRLWKEEEWVAAEMDRPLSPKHFADMDDYDLARQSKPGAAKLAVRWELIQRAKKRVNAGYNAMNKQQWKIKDTAPFRNQDEVSQFEAAVGLVSGMETETAGA